jgi:hypothetical protein
LAFDSRGGDVRIYSSAASAVPVNSENTRITAAQEFERNGMTLFSPTGYKLLPERFYFYEIPCNVYTNGQIPGFRHDLRGFHLTYVN